MPNETGDEQSKQTWPVPEFHFSVEISNVGKISCKEVSGLDAGFNTIEYRSGGMPELAKVKMPGLIKIGEVTLKKATLKGDKKVWDWINNVKMDIIQRENVTITLLNQSSCPVQNWKLTNAWLPKYTVEGFKADGNEISMETLVLAHEGVTPA